MIDKKNIKKILIIKLRGIGDVVLSTIVLDNLVLDFPDAKIDYLTDKPSVPVIKGLKQVNKVLVFPRKNTLDRIKLIGKIRGNSYDFVLDFFSNPTTALMTFLSGAKYKAGFPYRGRKYAYNLYGPKERGKHHAALLHLEMLKSIGVSSERTKLLYDLTKKVKDVADEYFSKTFSEDDFVVGLSPTGGWQSKKCSPEKLAETGFEIIKKYNAKILVIWGPSDFEDAIKIHQIIGNNSFLAPDTSLSEMAALISKCKILIANDSGPMHISTAVGTPVLSIHGPTNPLHQGPFGEKHEWVQYSELDCITCNLLECPRNHECFRDLPVTRIMEKVDSLIQKNNLLS